MVIGVHCSGWGGDVPSLILPEILSLASKVNVPVQYEVMYRDSDGDVIRFSIEKGKLIKHVNGKKQVGGRNKLDRSGVVTTVKFRAPYRIADQTGWGGNVPKSMLPTIFTLAQRAGVPVHEEVTYRDGDGDVIKFTIENGRLIKYVNGEKRVGGRDKLDRSGIVQSIKFRRPRRIADQTGWGGNVPGEILDSIFAMAKKTGVPVVAS